MLVVLLSCLVLLSQAGDAGRAGPEPFDPFQGTLAIGQDLDSASLDPQGRTGLDGLSLEQIQAFRLAKVREYERLGIFGSTYHPLQGHSRRIYESITPGGRWLGPTPYYVANPYVLVAMTCANHVTPLNLSCPDVQITYTHRRIDEVRRGASARCWLDRAFDPPYADRPGVLRIVMVNAFDAGFLYAHVDRERSLNVEPETSLVNVVNGLFSQPSFFHVGRYRANNISPEDPNGWVRLTKRTAPTRIHVKLWRRPPRSPALDADMVYQIAVVPSP